MSEFSPQPEMRGILPRTPEGDVVYGPYGDYNDLLEISDYPLLRSPRLPLGEYEIVSGVLPDELAGLPAGRTRAKHQALLNECFARALRSQERMDALAAQHAASPIRRVGRLVLNQIGIQTPNQADIVWHQNMIGHYRQEVQDTDTAALSLQRHQQLRDKLVNATFVVDLRHRLARGDADAQAFMTGMFGGADVADVSDGELVAGYDRFVSENTLVLPSEKRKRERLQRLRDGVIADDSRALTRDAAERRAYAEAGRVRAAMKEHGHATADTYAAFLVEKGVPLKQAEMFAAQYGHPMFSASPDISEQYRIS